MLDKEAIKEYLIKEKQRLQDQLYAEEGIGRSISLRDNVDELSLADNHPADLGSELFERSKDLSVREKQSYLLNNIELALAKLESGCYGICEHCGQEIMEERLEALPYVRLCIHCQEEEEKQFGSGHPIEEELIEPPFNRNIMPQSPSQDAEDFWQEVGRYNRRPGIFEDGIDDDESDTGKEPER